MIYSINYRFFYFQQFYHEQDCFMVICKMVLQDIIMRADEAKLISNIDAIISNQILLLEKPKNSQQEFFQLYAHRHMIFKDMIHKNIQKVLNYGVGTFCQKDLQINYTMLSLQGKEELSVDNFPFFKLVSEWKDYFDTFVPKEGVKLKHIIRQQKKYQFSNFEQYLAYLDYIAFDLIKLIMGNVTDQEINKKLFDIADKIDRRLVERQFNVQELLAFVNQSLPKIVNNLILPYKDLPVELRRQRKDVQCLFVNRSWEYHVKFNDNYSVLIRTVIKIILKYQVSPAHQKVLMQVVFKYFYAFHHNKAYKPLELFAQAFNWLDESTKFAMSDEFVLFLRVVKKVGKEKFVDYVKQKNQWIAEILNKIGEGKMIGNQKEGLVPFNLLDIKDRITIQNGKIETRTFEVLQQFSLMYFSIRVQSQDINVRIYYLGDIVGSQPVREQLGYFPGMSGLQSSCMIAMRRGLYRFQFDNSYSWINKKIVKFQNNILSPLQIKSQQEFKWINDFYGGLAMTSVNKGVILLKQIKLNKEGGDGIANITKNGLWLKFKIDLNNKRGGIEYESDNEKRFREKVMTNAKRYDLQWKINGEILDDIAYYDEEIVKLIKRSVQLDEPQTARSKIRQPQSLQQKEKSIKVQKQIEKSKNDNQKKSQITQKKSTAKQKKNSERVAQVIPPYIEQEELERKEELRKLRSEIPKPEVKIIKKKIQRKKIAKQSEIQED